MADKANPLPDPRSRARQQTQPPSSASEPAPPSIASRIQSSASGLLSSAAAGSSTGARAGHHASETLAASLAEKDGGSSQQPQTTFDRHTGGSRAGRTLGDTFRSSATQSDPAMDSPLSHNATDSSLQFDMTDPGSHGKLPQPQPEMLRDFAKFNHQKSPMSNEAEPSQSNISNITPIDAQAPERAWGSSSARAHPALSDPLPSESDGQAVVSLLSDPSFEPSAYIHDQDNEDIATEPNPYISTAQASQPPASHPNHVSPLTLVPGMNQIETQKQYQGRDLSTLSSLISPGDAPWLSLDALYHDAVYGNMLEPYVTAAEKEVAEYKPSRENEEEEAKLKSLREGTAVKRLQLMLGHVRAEAENLGTRKGQAKE